MDPIQPINGFEDEPLYPVKAVNTPPPPETSQKSERNILGIEIDGVRIYRDQEYYLSVLNYMMAKARAFFKATQYAFAKEIYEKIFRYYRVLKVSSREAQRIFFPAMLEYSYLTLLLNQKDEVYRFLNQELMQQLESSLANKSKPDLAAIRQTIKAEQEAGRLPALTQQSVPVPDEVILNLAEQFETARMPEDAMELLGHLEVRQLVRLLETRDQTEQLARKLPVPKQPPNPGAPPLWFSHWGLPIASIIPPLPGEEARKFKAPIMTQEQIVDRIESVPIAHNNLYRPKNKAARKPEKTGKAGKKGSRTKLDPSISW